MGLKPGLFISEIRALREAGERTEEWEGEAESEGEIGKEGEREKRKKGRKKADKVIALTLSGLVGKATLYSRGRKFYRQRLSWSLDSSAAIVFFLSDSMMPKCLQSFIFFLISSIHSSSDKSSLFPFPLPFHFHSPSLPPPTPPPPRSRPLFSVTLRVTFPPLPGHAHILFGVFSKQRLPN